MEMEEIEILNDEEAKKREDLIVSKILAFLSQYQLSDFSKQAALIRIRKMAGDAKNKRALAYVLQQISGLGAKAQTEGFSKWQLGCPQRIPHLRNFPFWEGRLLYETFPWVKDLEKAFPVIKKELLALKNSCTETPSGFQPYRSPTWSSQVKPDVKDDARIGAPAHDAGEWNVFYLHLHNVDFSSNRQRCPETVRLIESFGRSYGHAFFSAMAPKTHIVKHNGPTNKKLRVHLPLIVPGKSGDCRLRAGAEDNTRAFEEGKAMIFDDSFEHEAWNDTDHCRINLIFDVWHPDFHESEIKFFDILRKSQMRAEKKATEQALKEDNHTQYEAYDNLYAIIEATRKIRPEENKLWA
eukprot:g2392.t1